jgi:RNA polymerase sigma-70 factor (ECF subfamily)
LGDTDADLLPRCRQGDEGAWRELVSRHTRRVFSVSYQFTGRVDEAEDLTQEIFIKVYQTLHRFDPSSGAFGAWVTTVARHHAIDQYRRRRQERSRRVFDPEVLTRAHASGEGPAERAEREQRAQLVHRGLRALPADLREPLILCDLQGMPYAEIASLLGVPLGTIKSRINRARIELARRLVDHLGPLVATAGGR